ncbi:hypothetical protein BWP24_29040 (plasmid) [Vibrio campbellii]|nr:hypothetical protein BWP24_29040 [Vibrio campbellii]OTW01000.1 hypothetical protein BA739_18580 [Vibrio parahaemolyticus]OTW06745.1 hypothetical protein BA740_18240 [Vibrio parahaemolyticus]OTW13760.1 hypothetical protein BA742_21320 [Vibrio parahaemolyticus]
MRGLVLILSLWSCAVMAGQKVFVDSGKVIPIQIPTGQDVVIQFDEGQMVGVVPSSESYMAIESISQKKQVTIYGRSLTEKPIEVMFRGLDTNYVTKTTIEVVEHDDVPLNIAIQKKEQSVAAASSTRLSRAYSDYWDNPEFQNSSSLHDYDEKAAFLLRYVNQTFGPRYAIEKPPFPIRKISSFKPQPVDHLYRRGYLRALATEVYYGGGMTAIVFELKNTSLVPHEFEPFNVRGDFWTINPWKRNYDVNEKGILIGVVKGRLDRGMFKALGEGIK